MAENSNIDWTDDTLNVWIGCVEVRLVAPGGRHVPSECDNCYAKLFAATRMGYSGRDPDRPLLWGNPKTTPRHQTRNWRQVLRRSRRVAQAGGRRLVFAFSLSDVFEEHPQLGPWRAEFLELVETCPELDFLLLTKRPQNITRMVPAAWLRRWPPHVWAGTSAGTAESLRVRLPHLERLAELGVPVRFVSDEPTLEDFDPTPALRTGVVNWWITGGESGSDAGLDRPRINADPDWFRRKRDACLEYNVAYFHKQAGGRRPGTGKELDGRLWHQWPDTGLGPVGGVRATPSAELVSQLVLR
jgi:protein gp37